MVHYCEAVPTKKQSKKQAGTSSQRVSGLWKIAGTMPGGSFLVLMAILAGHDSCHALQSPPLFAFLNTRFLGAILLTMVLMATRSYRTTASLTLLMMGCAALVLGASSLMVGRVMSLSGKGKEIP